MRSAVFACSLVSTLVIAVACSSEAIGVDSCRRIEEARCKAAVACGVSLTTPVREGREVDDGVQACIRFYRDACRHGLAVTQNPGTLQVDKCVATISSGDCIAVKSPEQTQACSFLAAADAGPTQPSSGADATPSELGRDSETSPFPPAGDAAGLSDAAGVPDGSSSMGASDSATD
jgi:hypothetical protein